MFYLVVSFKIAIFTLRKLVTTIKDKKMDTMELSNSHSLIIQYLAQSIKHDGFMGNVVIPIERCWSDIKDIFPKDLIDSFVEILKKYEEVSFEYNNVYVFVSWDEQKNVPSVNFQNFKNN